jgi:hypothetical protein
MQSCFKEQIGRNLEVYVDDVIVKTRQGDTLILDLQEIFTNLSCFNIKLNPKKCTFGVPRDKLLKYIVTKHCIEANPKKISAITKLSQVRNVKDVQQLMGCLVALSHFVSHLGECEFPLFKLLKKSDSFHWTDEAQKALDDLKALISKPPIMASPEPCETLLLYVTATTQVISAARRPSGRARGTRSRLQDTMTSLLH